jgi:hypothetical protein
MEFRLAAHLAETGKLQETLINDTSDCIKDSVRIINDFKTYLLQADAMNAWGGLDNESEEFTQGLERVHSRLLAILQGTDWPNAAIIMAASLLQAMDNIQREGARTVDNSRAAQAAAKALMEQSQEIQNNTAQLVNDLRAAAADSALSDTAGYYRGEAERHQSIARRFMWAVGISAFLLVLGTVGFLIIAPPVIDQALSATTQVIDFVRGALGRLTILSVLGFVVGFCVRNYRINKHLETVNRSRYNALMTAQRFMASVEDTVRPIVAGELVKAIFASGTSGYLDSAGETTIIESPSAMLASVSKVAK